MRNLFLLLLLANLVFAMWWLWIEPTDRPDRAAAAPAVTTPRLMLVSEVDAMLAGQTQAREVAGLALAAPEPLSAGSGSIDAELQPESAPPVAGTAKVSGAESVDDPPVSAAIPDAQPATSTGLSPPVEAAVDVAALTPPPVEPVPDEADAAAVGAVAPEGSQTALPEIAPVDAGRCVSLGPFMDLGEATVAASRLRSDGLEPRQRLAEADVWMGYWVHLPAYPSRDAAVAVVTGLKEQGVEDIYIEPAGERRNTVSLGIFSDRARADAHAGRIRALGVEPAVTDRYRQDRVYWIDVDLAGGRVLDTSGYSSSASQVVRVEDDACAE